MDWDQLSDEAKETAKWMIQHCINEGACMGMDQGLDLGDTPDEDKPKPFRAELESFSGYEST